VNTNDLNAKVDGGRTNSALLDQVRDWRNDPAWTAFFDRYNSLMLTWCRRFGVEADASDELCQRIWIELMQRMRTFRYDPSLGFRGWLWRLFRCRAVDLMRQRQAAQRALLKLLGPEELQLILAEPDPPDDTAEFVGKPVSSILLRQAEEAQQVVRSRVDPETWRTYWMVAIEDRPVRETADSLGKSYTAVYNGYKRVDRMLRKEGARRLTEIVGQVSASREM
jgi:RNA polymerase sigma factor (sigma-70 family)